MPSQIPASSHIYSNKKYLYKRNSLNLIFEYLELNVWISATWNIWIREIQCNVFESTNVIFRSTTAGYQEINKSLHCMTLWLMTENNENKMFNRLSFENNNLSKVFSFRTWLGSSINSSIQWWLDRWIVTAMQMEPVSLRWKSR